MTIKTIMPLIVTSALLALPGCSQAQTNGTLSQSDIEQIVHDYIMDNPAIIEEALIKLESQRDWDSIKDVKRDIYNNPLDVSIGPESAKVTIVEFFDYNCTYCKRSTDWLVKTIDKHPKDVRVIFKELPILDSRSRTSRNAALAALAAGRQDKYLDMHIALMNATSLTQDRIEQIAENVGLNIKQFKKDINDPKLVQHLDDNISIGQTIRPLTGTPFFIIGEEYLAGASDQRLEAMLKRALKG